MENKIKAFGLFLSALCFGGLLFLAACEDNGDGRNDGPTNCEGDLVPVNENCQCPEGQEVYPADSTTCEETCPADKPNRNEESGECVAATPAPSGGGDGSVTGGAAVVPDSVVAPRVARETETTTVGLTGKCGTNSTLVVGVGEDREAAIANAQEKCAEGVDFVPSVSSSN